MGELIARVSAAHEAAGRVFGRGHLIALANGNGIFEADLQAFRAQKGERGKNEAGIFSDKEETALRDELIADWAVRIEVKSLGRGRSESTVNCRPGTANLRIVRTLAQRGAGARLGFHAVQVMEVRPPRLIPFSEALPEIKAAIAAKKRTETIHKLRGQFAEPFRLVPGRM